MPINFNIPAQTSEIKIFSDPSESITFYITKDRALVNNISAARFVIAAGLPGLSYVVDVSPVIDNSQGTCTVGMSTVLPSGDYVGELSITLSTGDVYTPWQANISIS